MDETGAVTTCIELTEGLVAWGPSSGTWEEGLGLILTCYFAGLTVAFVSRTFLERIN